MSKYYPYELHCHTYHSDGKMSPQELITEAQMRGLKGIALTDHNTYSGLEPIQECADKVDFVLLKGIEWTTFWGHFTVFGGEGIDWRRLAKDNIDLMLQKAKERGAIVNVAHPFRLAEPVCTGCRMEYPISAWHNISGYEIASGPSPYKQASNSKALMAYEDLLARGYRIAALYGYDWHSKDRSACYGATYLPVSNALDALRAIANGDTFVSIGLNIDIKIDNNMVAFGSSLTSGMHKIDITICRDNLELCSNFLVTPKKIIIKGTACNIDIAGDYCAISADLQGGYFRVEVVGDTSEAKDVLLLSTSPIYVKGAELC